MLPRRKRRIERVWVLDGDKFKFRYNEKPRRGGSGFGLSHDVMYTLNTIDKHMVGIITHAKKTTHKDRGS